MSGSMTFVNGPGGGTPIDATSLNKLAVTADVATAGTPTGDALKAAFTRRPLIYSDFTGAPNGTPTVADTGQPFILISTPIVVQGGALTAQAPATGDFAGYATVRDPTNSLNWIGGDFSFANIGAANLAGVANFTIWEGDYVLGQTRTRGHVNIQPGGWAYYVRDVVPGNVQVIASGTFATLAYDTTYRFECEILDNTAYLLLPGGSQAVTVTDPRIGSIPGGTANWEPAGNANQLARYSRIWCGHGDGRVVAEARHRIAVAADVASNSPVVTVLTPSSPTTMTLTATYTAVTGATVTCKAGPTGRILVDTSAWFDTPAACLPRLRITGAGTGTPAQHLVNSKATSGLQRAMLVADQLTPGRVYTVQLEASDATSTTTTITINNAAKQLTMVATPV